MDTVSGLTGVYYKDGTEHIFIISNDGLFYSDSEDHKLKYTSSNGTDCIIFKNFEVSDSTDVTVILSDITGQTGVRTLYYGNLVDTKSGFSWAVYTSD